MAEAQGMKGQRQSRPRATPLLQGSRHRLSLFLFTPKTLLVTLCVGSHCGLDKPRAAQPSKLSLQGEPRGGKTRGYKTDKEADRLPAALRAQWTRKSPLFWRRSICSLETISSPWYF